jgi:hypothetical protein
MFLKGPGVNNTIEGTCEEFAGHPKIYGIFFDAPQKTKCQNISTTLNLKP